MSALDKFFDFGVPSKLLLADVKTPVHGLIKYVVEVAHTYTFNATSTATPNGTTIIATTDGTKGNWIEDTDPAAAAASLGWKTTVRVVATSNITLSGTQTIDGVALSVNDRVLVAGQATASQNGLYVVQAGAWTRAVDADSNPEVTANLTVWVAEGTAKADTGWTLITNDPIVLGSTSLTFQQWFYPTDVNPTPNTVPLRGSDAVIKAAYYEGTKDAIGATVGTPGATLQNTTAAADGAQQYSPALRLIGRGWTGISSSTLEWAVQNRTIQGESESALDFYTKVDAGSYTRRIYLTPTSVSLDSKWILGTTGMTWDAGVSAVTYTQTQDASAAGAITRFESQRGFAGFAGGDLVLQPGKGGTLGTDLSGNLVFDLGTALSGGSQNTGKVVFRNAAGDQGWVRLDNFGGANTLHFDATNVLAFVSASSVFFQGAALRAATSGYFAFENNSFVESVRIDPINHKITWKATTATPMLDQTIHASGAGENMTVRAQGAGGTNNNGGALHLEGGARTGTGLKGGVRLRMHGTTETLAEVVSVVDGQRVVSLCRAADLTSTQMPANTGDGVIYIANATTAPTASAVGGGILYAEGGVLKWRGSSGTVTTIAPA